MQGARQRYGGLGRRCDVLVHADHAALCQTEELRPYRTIVVIVDMHTASTTRDHIDRPRGQLVTQLGLFPSGMLQAELTRTILRRSFTSVARPMQPITIDVNRCESTKLGQPAFSGNHISRNGETHRGPQDANRWCRKDT